MLFVWLPWPYKTKFSCSCSALTYESTIILLSSVNTKLSFRLKYYNSLQCLAEHYHLTWSRKAAALISQTVCTPCTDVRSSKNSRRQFCVVKYLKRKIVTLQKIFQRWFIWMVLPKDFIQWKLTKCQSATLLEYAFPNCPNVCSEVMANWLFIDYYC